jgi:hypothetical protein
LRRNNMQCDEPIERGEKGTDPKHHTRREMKLGVVVKKQVNHTRRSWAAKKRREAERRDEALAANSPRRRQVRLHNAKRDTD